MKTHNLLHSWGPGIDNRDWGGLSPRIRLVLACFGYPDQTTHLRLGQLRVAGGLTKDPRFQHETRGLHFQTEMITVVLLAAAVLHAHQAP